MMKSISLWQPWASLLVNRGFKVIETRSRNWSYRGDVAVHASATIPKEWQRVVDGQMPAEIPEARYFIEALRKIGVNKHTDLPTGAVLGTNRIVDSFPLEAVNPPYPEKAFGDYRPGRHGLLMPFPMRFKYPIPAKGSLGLWDWEPEGTLLYDGMEISFEGRPAIPGRLFAERHNHNRFARLEGIDDQGRVITTRLAEPDRRVHVRVTYANEAEFERVTGLHVGAMELDDLGKDFGAALAFTPAASKQVAPGLPDFQPNRKASQAAPVNPSQLSLF